MPSSFSIAHTLINGDTHRANASAIGRECRSKRLLPRCASVDMPKCHRAYQLCSWSDTAARAVTSSPSSRTKQWVVKPRVGEWEMPLRQTCSEEYLGAQYAFKVL
eukprot:COSAG01_NODE_46152_length_402_cov_3.174917_1_plen_104_part_01